MIKSNLTLETKLWGEGNKWVAGVDEVGRGCWAGRVYAACVVFEPNQRVDFELSESKILNKKGREKFAKEIIRDAKAYGYGFVESEVIDHVGLAESVRLAMEMAVNECESILKEKVDIIIVDGASVRDLQGRKQIKEDKADMHHFTVAAASIIAKVERDRYMDQMAAIYPNFAFEKNKGYGTKLHIEGLNIHGPCPIHRLSYKPVQAFAESYGKEGKRG